MTAAIETQQPLHGFEKGERTIHRNVQQLGDRSDGMLPCEQFTSLSTRKRFMPDIFVVQWKFVNVSLASHSPEIS
jgi:hypothetical protein